MKEYYIKIENQGEALRIKADEISYNEDGLMLFLNDEPIACIKTWTYWVVVKNED